MRLHFFNSAVIANSKMDYYGTYLGSIFFLVSYKVANGLLQPCRLVLYGFDSYAMLIQGSLTNDDGDGYENVTWKENSDSFKLYRTCSNCWQILSEFNPKGLHQSSGKEEESCCLVFPSWTKREIRHFHAVVVHLWPCYGFLCKRFSLYVKVYIKTHKTAINRPVDHTGET